jgi:hypothetical protein
MTDWVFLIQREGDRGWRTIKTGNLQLTEGKYRIVANSSLLSTRIQTRITHQTLDSTAPQRQSRSGDRTSNSRGIVIIIPFMHLQSGIWQFVCRGMTGTPAAWHQVLKLRVLPRTQPNPVSANDPLSARTVLDPSSYPDRQDRIHSTKVSPRKFTNVETAIDRSDPPTEPIVPLAILGDARENWADELDRLLAQLERDSLQTPPRQPDTREILAGVIQLSTIFDPPSQPICLDRSTFSGLIPGNRLTISGTCNLQLVNASPIRSVKIEKLSICLRHPQTSETIISIEQPLPPDLDTFAFRGQIELPMEPKTTLLLGEVNLYDKYHIQLGSSGFTVTVNLNPLYESELSSLKLFDGVASPLEYRDDHPEATLAQLTQELKIEAVTIGLDSSTSRPTRFPTPSTIQPLTVPQYPTIPLAYKRESLLARHPDIVAVKPSTTNQIPRQKDERIHAPTFLSEITDDLNLDFADLAIDRATDARHYPNLEVVIDD